MTDQPDSLGPDLLWGIDAIALYIGRTRSAAFKALTKNELPARQVNGRWVASKSALAQHFGVPTSKDAA